MDFSLGNSGDFGEQMAGMLNQNARSQPFLRNWILVLVLFVKWLFFCTYVFSCDEQLKK